MPINARMDDQNDKQRLDQHLVAAGLAPTRARARDLIRRGFVCVDEAVCIKPAQTVGGRTIVALACDAPVYVSRGAEKLSSALDRFGFDVTGRLALDIGASTGGFTQVLLERGARKVYAVDVGTGQMHAALRADARVVTLEGVDARALDGALIPEPVGVIAADVSFISLTKVLPAALACAAKDAVLAALIKPQFELTPDDIGKGGIVRSKEGRERAVASVRDWLSQCPGWRTLGVIPSPILGGSGNAEFLIGAVCDG